MPAFERIAFRAIGLFSSSQEGKINKNAGARIYEKENPPCLKEAWGIDRKR
jgi:hypothetical protein